jgi:hypothetical protein
MKKGVGTGNKEEEWKNEEKIRRGKDKLHSHSNFDDIHNLNPILTMRIKFVYLSSLVIS